MRHSQRFQTFRGSKDCVMTLAPCLLQEEELEPLWILFPDDVDSWQNSLWRFIFPPQTSRINENKIQRLCLSVVGDPHFFRCFFLNTQKNKWFKAPYLLWFGQSIHALHLQTPSVCFTQTPSLISAALQFLAFGTVVRAFLHRITPKSHLHCAHHCLSQAWHP